jgi:hypothetical protein
VGEVGIALSNLRDLNATLKSVNRELIDVRGRLLSNPKDSPPTRDLIRQLAILNKRATELAQDVFRADLEYQAAVEADIEAKREAELLVLQEGSLRLYKYFIRTNAESGKRFVVGDLKNSGTNAVSGVSVEFNLYDASEKPLETTSSFVGVIEAGTQWRFEALIFDDLAERANFKRLNWEGKDAGEPSEKVEGPEEAIKMKDLFGVYQNANNVKSGEITLRRRIVLSKGNGDVLGSGKLVHLKEATNGEQIWWESSDEVTKGSKKEGYKWTASSGSAIEVKGGHGSLAEGVTIEVSPDGILRGKSTASIFSGEWKRVQVKDAPQKKLRQVTE